MEKMGAVYGTGTAARESERVVLYYVFVLRLTTNTTSPTLSLLCLTELYNNLLICFN